MNSYMRLTMRSNKKYNENHKNGKEYEGKWKW